ncbi:MAG: zinc ribbon domain-containing protein [Candidatus Heimdallarchaeota archaeon]
MKRGGIPAIISVFLPTYLLIYFYSENEFTLFVAGSVGLFMVITTYSETLPNGENNTGTGFAIFDPNWYLDLKKLNVPSSREEAMNNSTIRAAYGNLRDRSEGAELALGFAGMLFGVFVLLLLGGIILNLMDQEKNSGILFLIAGAASLGAMLLAWDGVQAVNSVGDSFPIPVGVLLVFFAGYRAYTGEKVKQKKMAPYQMPPHQTAKEQFCVHCGASLLPPGKFCTKCGKDQP